MRVSTMLGALGLASVLLSARPTWGTPPVMVPATFQPHIDSRGISWSTMVTGGISTSDNILQNAAVMSVAGHPFSSSQSEMTPDGREAVLTGQCGDVHVTRRIHFDPLACTARLVETFSNPGPQDLGQVEIALVVPLRFMNGYYSDTGTASPATLDAQATGLIAYPRLGRGSAVAWWLCSAKARVKPVSITSQNNRYVQVTYQISLPPGAKMSIMHGFGEFQAALLSGRPVAMPTDPKSLSTFMATCDAKKWVRELPSDIRRTLVNTSAANGVEGPKGLLPASLAAALERADIERGLLDVLAVDAESQVEGTARCKRLSLTCPRGNVELQLDDVALVSGGSGRGRPATVYLRNGEVLVGELAADDFMLSTAEGLKIELVPAQMTLLAMHVAPADSHPSESIVALATLATGERLALRSEPKQKLTVVTAWGTAHVAWDQLQWLAYEQTPQPVFRAVFRDRSRLSVFLSGPELELNTTRWGTLKLAARELYRWDSSLASAAPAKSENESDADNELPGPFVRMAGENMLAAPPTNSQLHLVTATGTRTIPTEQIERMTREDDGQFRCELAEGSILAGSLQEPRLSVRWQNQQFHIPVQQVIGLRGASDEGAPAAAAEN